MLTFFAVVLGVIIGNILSAFIVLNVFSSLLREAMSQQTQETNVKTKTDSRFLKVDYIVNEKGEHIFHVFDESNDMFLLSTTTYKEIEQFCISMFVEKGIVYVLPQKDVLKILQISKELV